MTEATADKATILVVDDSRLMRVAARKILKNDFDIVEAEDGDVAWDALQSNQDIELVMSDLSMPNLDGLGLLKAIRESSDARINGLPVIIVTGAEDDDGSKNNALTAGASDFITKPFESVQLLARAKSQVEQKRTRQALHESETSKQTLAAQSNVDPLTGLSNQQSYRNSIEESLSYAIRHRTEIAIVLLQVDKFKVLFLRHGKHIAEDILSRIARLLTERRRREDTVARFGLDTFGILLPSANLVGAKSVARQLQQVIKQQDFNIGGQALDVTVTLAVSSPAIDAQTSCADLLGDAGEKLRIGQQGGGNCIQDTLDQTQPDDPAHGPAVSEETHPPRTASSNDVERALHALARGDKFEEPADELARAVLPILEAWNQAHGNAYNDLIGQLQSALQGINHQEALVDSAAGRRTESL